MNRRSIGGAALCALACAALGAAPVVPSFRLTEEDFQILSEPDRILQVLAKQTDEEYPDTTQLLAAIQKDLEGHPDIFRTVSNIVRTEINPRTPPEALSLCPADLEAPCPVGRIWLDSLNVVELQAKLVAKRRLHPYPKILLDLVHESVGVDYPEEELLHQAVLNHLDAGIGSCTSNLPLSQSYTHSRRLPDSSFIALMEQIIPLAPSIETKEIGGNSTVGLLTTFRKQSAACSMQEKEQIRLLLQGIYDSTLREAVHSLCRKNHPASPPQAPRWRDSSCGCVRKELNGVVFGIYPWWRADTTVQTLDFSVVNRIEFMGLSFDDAGILSEFPATDAGASRLVRTVHDHEGKLDWVVTRSDWESWKGMAALRRKEAFDTLAGRIAAYLARPLPDLWSRFRSHIPYPGRERFTWGDGVTLHFPGYPTDSVSVALFSGFFGRLDTLLSRIDPEMEINVMLSRPALSRNQGIFSYANLLELLKRRGADSAEEHLERTHLLVLLDEPSRDTKKVLQRELDFNLHGSERRLFVHALVPVSLFDGKNGEQLSDDIYYDSDTYYGMGVWPVPFASAAEAAKPDNMARKLSETILDGYRKNKAVSHFRALESWICLHRWEIRLLFAASLLLSLAVAGLTALHCRLRHFLARHVVRTLALLVVPPLTLFTLLLYFDPDLATLAEGNVPFIGLATLTVLGAAGTGIYLRSKQVKPSREAMREELRRRGGGR